MSAIQRMIDEMRRRGYAKKTIAEYSGSVRRLATYFGKCPSKLTLEQIRAYQLHLAERKDISASYYNATVTALRFLYLQTLERDWSIDRLPYGRREHRLPVVLSRQEVFQLWRPLRQLKRRLLLMTAYSAALRTSELVQLRVEDLDAQGMQIRVRQDDRKGERLVPYASHCLAAGMEVGAIQQVLGHASLETTATYSVGVERGVHYYAMELVEGRSLAQAIAELRTATAPDAADTKAETAAEQPLTLVYDELRKRVAAKLSRKAKPDR